jgi:signal transduction histidine kinase
MGQMDAEAAKVFQFGDIIQAVGGRRVHTPSEIFDVYAQAGEGAVLGHQILRAQQVLHVSSRVRPFGWHETWLTAGPSIVLSFGFLALGLFLAWKGRAHAEARTLSVWLGAFGLALIANGVSSLVHSILLVWLVAASLLGGLLLRLTMQVGYRRQHEWLPVIGSLGMAMAVSVAHPLAVLNDDPAILQQFGFYAFLGVAMLWPLLIGAVVFPFCTWMNMRRVERFSLAFQQNRIILWSSVLAFLPVLGIWIPVMMGLGMPMWVARGSLLSFLLMPTGMLFAVLRYRLFDIEILIRRTLVYSALAGLLAITYTATIGLLLQLAGPSHGEVARLGLFMVMALAFDPLRRHGQDWLDRVFDRGRVSILDVQRRINQRAAEHKDTSQTLDGVARDVQEALRLTRVAIALPHEGQLWIVAGRSELLGQTVPISQVPDQQYWLKDDVPDFLWPEGIDAGYAIIQRDRLLAILLLGEHKSQEPFTSQDFDYLGLISGQLGLLLSYTQVLDRQEVVNREMQKLMRQVSDLNDLRSSFGIVAGHELRTPLTVIKGHAEALMSGVFGDLDPEQYESVQSIFRSATSLSSHITSYLDLVALREKKLVLKPMTSDVGTLIFELLETWQPFLEEKDLALRVDVDAVDKIHADPRRTRQVFEQLLSNAIKFTPAGGNLMITARTEGASALVSFIDSGPGIPMEALERAFDDFAQVADPTKRDQGGLGLGLPLARSLMEAMNGQLLHEPGINGGAIFTCVLPVPGYILQQRQLLHLLNTDEPIRLKTVADPRTGLWRVRPEGAIPPSKEGGITMDRVVYENAPTDDRDRI